MQHPRYSSEEIVRRGQQLYDEHIRAEVEPEHTGKFLVVDIETGEYEIDRESLPAFQRALAKHPGAALFLVRIGYPTAVRLGGKFRSVPS